jgi:hypothetical protein
MSESLIRYGIQNHEHTYRIHPRSVIGKGHEDTVHIAGGGHEDTVHIAGGGHAGTVHIAGGGHVGTVHIRVEGM